MAGERERLVLSAALCLPSVLCGTHSCRGAAAGPHCPLSQPGPRTAGVARVSDLSQLSVTHCSCLVSLWCQFVSGCVQGDVR